MPRELHDREDLLRDARALVPRLTLQIRLAESPITVFAGFRGDALSLYFGDDPVFHFNAHGELRRAFMEGCLIKAHRGRLADLQRESNADAVRFVLNEFDEARQGEFLGALMRSLAEFRAAMEAGQFTLVGQEPPEGEALERLCQWLSVHKSIGVAASPGVG